jgi:Mg-chelatase subunit ChlD
VDQVDQTENPDFISADERLRRWRLALGEADSAPRPLTGDDQRIDAALNALYGGNPATESGRTAGLGGSAPNLARWLGDIRNYFPASVVRVMQQDAIERLNLRELLLEPELLAAVEPDVHLAAELVALNQAMPTQTRATARQVVDQVVDQITRRLAAPMRQAVMGALSRAERNRRPRHNEMDWPRTIRANLKHYQTAYRTVIPQTRHGFGRRRPALRDVILCIDQSGSMATSVVYASVFGAVLASLPALSTRVIVFDTAVIDLSDRLHDPVDLLFGAQLGGGTDINRALTYCQGLIRRPRDTILVLISDLVEGGERGAMFERAAEIVGSEAQLIALLALSDDGAPEYDREAAGRFAALGCPTFACTPDAFPELMAAAISRRDVNQWAAGCGITTAAGSGTP